MVDRAKTPWQAIPKFVEKVLSLIESASPVLSVFGRTGNVTAQNADYTAAQVGAVAVNGAITGATKTKITYDAKGLVTSGADATTADIADSSNRRYVTDAQLTVVGNTSGTNTGDSASDPSGSAAAVLAVVEWRKVEVKVFASDATSFDFATVIDSSVDDAYKVEMELISAVAANNSVSPRLNGAVVAMTRQVTTAQASTLTADRNTGTFVNVCGNVIGDRSRGWFALSCTSRLFEFAASPRKQSGSYGSVYGGGEITTPSAATQLTSIGIESNQANGLKAGTKLTLYKRL